MEYGIRNRNHDYLGIRRLFMKNMNWKKAVSLLMAAVLVGSLTACSGGQGQKEASTELQKAEEKESAESTQAKGN